MSSANKLYLVGSLRNERVPSLAKKLRHDLAPFPHRRDMIIFDDWYTAGPEADDYWKEYEQKRGRTYRQALDGYAANHVFDFDRHHLDTSSHVLLVLPAGKSGHMELMYGAYGVGAEAAILLDETDIRWDVMYKFIPNILYNEREVVEWLTK